jgi:hypothetical protein
LHVLLREIIGHRRLTTLLARAIERNSLPPTLLFSGPHGVGKWAVARAMAQALNCLDPSTRVSPASQDSRSLRAGPADAPELPIDACGKCRACDRIARNVHVDVIALEPDDKAAIRIDVVREMLERTAFRPFEGKRRVVMIREADALTEESQNSLLKSLEEPSRARCCRRCDRDACGCDSEGSRPPSWPPRSPASTSTPTPMPARPPRSPTAASARRWRWPTTICPRIASSPSAC